MHASNARSATRCAFEGLLALVNRARFGHNAKLASFEQIYNFLYERRDFDV
jgi:hypothetical protein